MGTTNTTADPAQGSQAYTRTQLLAYARDLAELHRRLRGDQARLAGIEGKLDELTRVSLDLIEATSAEAAAGRTAEALAAGLPSSRVAVYAVRGGRLRLLASQGAPPSRAAPAEEELGDRADAGPWVRSTGAWAELVEGSALVVAFPGRSGRRAGVAVARWTGPADGPVGDARVALALLSRYVGVVLESHRLDEVRRPSTAVARPVDMSRAILGRSPSMRAVTDLVRRMAPAPSSVLVTGETGTGKELVARAIHELSGRKGPFVALNCGAIPEGLVESELFGHEVGAFTGAARRHRGKVELANGGTLFLDEIGDMPKLAQVKVLRFLQEQRYTPVGGEEDKKADVRIVAATHRDLQAAAAAGDFREDLLFRLSVLQIQLPRLRDRGDDVVELARAFADELAERMGRPALQWSPGAERALRAYRWPGNVRELRNVVERAVVLATESTLGPEVVPGGAPASSASAPPVRPAGTPVGGTPAPAPPALPGEGGAPSDGGLGLGPIDTTRPFADVKAEVLERFELEYCRAILERCGGNLTRAAREAGMDRKNLTRKAKTYGLRSQDADA